MMKFFISTLVFAAVVYQTNGLCNTCSATTGLACVGPDKFKVCLDGIPQSPSIQCPTGTVCTPNAQVCAPGTVSPSCGKCEQCNANKIFACIGFNTFTVCGGTDVPDTSVEYACPDGLVCSIDSDFICIDGNVTGIGATCPWSEPITTPTTPSVIVTTTPNALTNPDEFCANQGFPGRYIVSADTTCQQYISCVSVSGQWTGNLYECPKATYFNGSTQMCGVDKPSRCP